MRLSRLTLTDFRNYPTLTWSPDQHIVVITGPNGSGKTNLLEAVSLLSPGRGLRSARAADFVRRGAERWGVHGRVWSNGTEHEVGTGSAPQGDRRVFRLDGMSPRNQSEVAGVFACVWLTPQMDRLFQEGASGRRRFLDRLVWALEPGHAREVAAYESAMAGRNRLLAQFRSGARGADAAWLSGLEDSMARHGVAAAAARAGLVARLNGALTAGAAGSFPAARLVLVDALADRLASGPALAAEDWLRATLAADRTADAAAGSAAHGAHRADLLLEDAATGLPAAQASTGQQKALLIGVVLGHAKLIAVERAAAPLLLLDEPAVHLDAVRRGQLWAALEAGPSQVLLTGTDREAFAPLHQVAGFWRTGDGNLVQDGGQDAEA
jgi:DNA replication and repair protein RecF